MRRVLLTLVLCVLISAACMQWLGASFMVTVVVVASLVASTEFVNMWLLKRPDAKGWSDTDIDQFARIDSLNSAIRSISAIAVLLEIRGDPSLWMHVFVALFNLALWWIASKRWMRNALRIERDRALATTSDVFE